MFISLFSNALNCLLSSMLVLFCLTPNNSFHSICMTELGDWILCQILIESISQQMEKRGNKILPKEMDSRGVGFSSKGNSSNIEQQLDICGQENIWKTIRCSIFQLPLYPSSKYLVLQVCVFATKAQGLEACNKPTVFTSSLRHLPCCLFFKHISRNPLGIERRQKQDSLNIVSKAVTLF